MSIKFFTLDHVLKLHKKQIEYFGGIHGIRDIDLLKSALAQPIASFRGEYFHKDVYEMAAAYLYHLVQNHPFLDGNKRTGAYAALTFLKINGVHVNAAKGEILRLVLSVTEGKTDKPGLAEFFKKYS